MLMCTIALPFTPLMKYICIFDLTPTSLMNRWCHTNIYFVKISLSHVDKEMQLI